MTESIKSSVTTRAPVELTAVPAEVWKVAGVVVFGAFMASMDISLVNVGLDNISHRLHGSLSSVQWTTSGYLIALAGVLPICAWLGRRVGAGRLWLGAVVGFTVASGLCAAAPNLMALIVLRVFQGITGGLLIPTGQTVIGQVAGPTRMGRVMSTVGIAVILAPALGPIIGGVLIAHLSWRWLFLINLPVGVLALILGLRVVPRGERTGAGMFDLIGFVLIGTGLPLLTYGIISASQQRTFTTAPVLASLAIGVTAVVLCIQRSLYCPAPVLDLRLFGNRVYTAAETAVFFSGASLFGGMIVLPLYFELLLAKGVMETGLLLLAYGGGAALSMRFGGQLTDRLGGGVTSAVGLTITVATTLPFVFLSADANLVSVEILQFLRGIGVGMAGMPAMSTAYATVGPVKLPDATAQTNILQRFGGALGSALFVVILENTRTTGITAFHTTFWWLSGSAVIALLAAIWLSLEQRRSSPER